MGVQNQFDESLYCEFVIRACFGMASLAYILVIFGQNFIISSVSFAPMITLFFFKTSKEIGGDTYVSQAILTSLFTIFVYVSIAYKVERLSKQCFLGREHFDKSFKKWLMIFETFPEGVSMVKEDGSVMYSNGSMSKILEHPGAMKRRIDGHLNPGAH